MTSKSRPSSHNPLPQNDILSIQRGDYGPSPILTTLVFTLLRLITVPLQYYIITSHPLHTLFPSTIPSYPLSITTTHLPLNIPLPHSVSKTLNLPLLPTIFTSMPLLLTIKKLIWYHVMMRERMTLPFAILMLPIDILYECLSSLIFTLSLSSLVPFWSPSLFYTSYAIFTIAVITELVSELQRHAFKTTALSNDRKGRKGGEQICKTGLWGVVRHVNYAANMVFGAAYGMACGGPLYSVCTGAMYVMNLGFNATPAKEEYMKQKYGVEWEAYVRDVRWKYFPGVW